MCGKGHLNFTQTAHLPYRAGRNPQTKVNTLISSRSHGHATIKIE